MSSLGAVGANAAAQAGRAAANASAETDKGKDDKAEFQKKLTQTALMLAANTAFDAQDTTADLEDDDE
jgi:hypothetical protein